MSINRVWMRLAVGVASVFWAGGLMATAKDGAEAGWGIDACLTCHVEPAAIPEWLGLVEQSRVAWLRERGSWGEHGEISPEMKARYALIKAAGFKIVGFAGTPSLVGPRLRGNQLPEDLQAVYAAAFKQGKELAHLVSAWELAGEPDVGYCRDLPDRLAAYNKAMYLGLRDGAAAAGEAPIILKGALALPPGPWWERATANGLLDYTDAYNFHFYGHAADLTSVIEAHQYAVRVSERMRKPEAGDRDVRPDGARQRVEGADEQSVPRSESGAGDRERVPGGRTREQTGGLKPEGGSRRGKLDGGAMGDGRWGERDVGGGRTEDGGRTEGGVRGTSSRRKAAPTFSEWGATKTGRPADRSGYHPPSVIRPPSSTGRSLPLWITECGVSATVAGDFFNEARRAFQAEFTVSTARQALAAPDVAVFMPFILVHKNDPHALVVAQNLSPFPAWEEYAKFTRENPWPERALAVRAGERANPVVVQWMPAEGTATHKVAGTYRVGEGGFVEGELRVFNFGDGEAVGSLKVEGGNLKMEVGGRRTEVGDLKPETGNRKLEIGVFAHEIHEKTRNEGGGTESRKAGEPEGRRGGEPEGRKGGEPEGRRGGLPDGRRGGGVLLRVPAGGSVAVPVRFTPEKAKGYFREQVAVRFLEDSGRTSRAVFGVERRPVESDFRMEPVGLRVLAGESRAARNPLEVEGVSVGPWRVFNGLGAARGAECSMTNDQCPMGGRGCGEEDMWRFSVAKPVNDPLAPTYAVAALDGVPADARFLRVRLDKPMTGISALRVDLIDDDGQRFTIWENMGNVYGEASRDVWLALEDFHPYFWSTTVPGKLRVDSKKVREISLRVYLPQGGSMEVGLEWGRGMTR